MVKDSKALPTQLRDFETVEELTAKCDAAAAAWAPVADKLWSEKEATIGLEKKVL